MSAIIESEAFQRDDLCAGQAAHSPGDSLKIPGCHSLYGVIADKSSRTNTTICSRVRQGLDDRQQFDEDRSIQTKIYTSRSNQLNIFIKQGLAEKFIVRVEGRSSTFFIVQRPTLDHPCNPTKLDSAKLLNRVVWFDRC